MAARPPRAAASRHARGTCSSTHALTTAVISADDDKRSSGSLATERKIYIFWMAAITDEGVARLRRRIGVAQPHPQPPHYLVPNEDAFRHVAEAYGDDNPLWCDPEYAAKSRWGGVIAPPHLVGGDTLIGENEVSTVDPDTKELLRGDPIRGAHAFYAGSFREWWAPLRSGTRVSRRNALVGVHDKQSEFAERAVHEWTAEVFAALEGPVLSAQYRLMIRTDRDKATERKKYDDI